MKPLSLLAMGMIFAISAGNANAQGNGPGPAAPPMGSMPMQHHAGMRPMAGMHEYEGMGGPAMMHGAGSLSACRPRLARQRSARFRKSCGRSEPNQ